MMALSERGQDLFEMLVSLRRQGKTSSEQWKELEGLVSQIPTLTPYDAALQRAVELGFVKVVSLDYDPDGPEQPSLFPEVA